MQERNPSQSKPILANASQSGIGRAILAVLMAATICPAEEPYADYQRFRNFLVAVSLHETQGHTIFEGDGGTSIGWLHCGRLAWQDGCERGGVDFPWFDTFDWEKCVYVAWHYFLRHEPEALAAEDWETLARLWNGGPEWRKKPITLRYWRQVKERMP